jgi:hypothetical protein
MHLIRCKSSSAFSFAIDITIIAAMLALFTAPELIPTLRDAGIDARLAWHSDHDSDALVMVPAEPENLRKLDQWLGGRPRISLAAVAA